mmetsp:Transcript_2783/g.8410  ORF Transcript_2783/g.8410 Transcript_2783/m.8410 type:complete len:333 (-) Transcript_2783:575-1573(-)
MHNSTSCRVWSSSAIRCVAAWSTLKGSPVPCGGTRDSCCIGSSGTNGRQIWTRRSEVKQFLIGHPTSATWCGRARLPGDSSRVSASRRCRPTRRLAGHLRARAPPTIGTCVCAMSLMTGFSHNRERMSSEEPPRSQLERDILDSDKAFRAEFDRSSTTFHGGSTEAVPLGGSRVPESMAENTEATVEDDRMARLTELRQALNKLKRSAAGVIMPIDGIVRVSERLSSAPSEALLHSLATYQAKRDMAVSAMESELEGTVGLARGLEIELGIEDAVRALAVAARGASPTGSADGITKVQRHDVGELFDAATRAALLRHTELLEEVKKLKGGSA